ncbi:hypothetical protein BDV10DRAFT_183934 [Aspergillus recurvatus]
MTKPPLPASSVRAVTIYTNTGPDQAAQDPLFVGRRFSHSQAATIGSHLRASLRACASQNRALIIVFSGSPSEPWLLDTLDSALNGFPRDLFGYLKLEKGQGPSTAVRPFYDDEKEEFSFLLNYLSASHGRTEQNIPTMDFEDGTITIQGVAALILSASRLDRNGNDDEPVIILWLASLGLLPRLDKYLAGPENSWRMNRLLHCPLWIYMDLFQACGDWPGVWDVARRDVARRDAQAYEDSLRPSTLHLTRRLHKAASNVITLREDLRLHIASFERIQHHISQRTTGPWPSRAPFRATLAERAADLLDDLDHHWETSGVISNQYNSLLGLVFNTETVAQGQAVARLNILAFAFLPLSFVSGIFGMSTFSVSAVWYPLWAAVALAAVATAAYLAGKLSGEASSGPYSFLHQYFARRLRRDTRYRSPSDHDLHSRMAIVPAAAAPTTQAPPGLGRWDSVRKRRPSQRARRMTEREERLRRNAPTKARIQRAPSSDPAEESDIPQPVTALRSDGGSNDRLDVSHSSDEEGSEHMDDVPDLPQVEPPPHHRLHPIEDYLRVPVSGSSRVSRSHSGPARRVQRGVTLLHHALGNQQD